MICPYYKNKEVFDGFNELIETFGGRPMTEEEFRSVELRNQRTGLDFAAMEAAYTLYDKNGGNFLDLTPQGKPSILFQTLLDLNKGDRQKAIIQKSNVYSEAFINWFGDWERAARKNTTSVHLGETIKIDNVYYTVSRVEDATPLYKENGLSTSRNIPVIYVKESLGTRTGSYVPSIDAIVLSEKNSDLKTLKHELVHSIEYSINSETLVPLYEKVKETITEDSFETVVSNNFRKNIHEFIADTISSEIFRNALQKEGLLDDVDTLINQLINDNGVSKVVDENGEPMVVYHYSDDNNLREFTTEFDNYFSKSGGTKEAIFFTEDNPSEEERRDNFITARSNKIAVFLNIKDLLTHEGTKEDLHKQGTTYREVVNNSASKNNKDGGVHMKDFDDNKKEHQNIWIVHNPNQIKSATGNKGTFSKEDNDIYNTIVTSNGIEEQLPQQFEVASLSQFGTDITTRLLNGEAVSSKEIVQWFINTDSLSKHNLRLASILSKHDIPIVLDSNMKGIILASTITNKKTKKSVITLNRNLINKVTNGYLGESILHEVVHAVTVNAINNPTTEIENRFVELNKKLMNKMREYMGYHDDLRHDVDLGTYALYNEKEFAAVFITDDQVRKQFIQIARRIDKQQNGTFKSILKRFINAVSELFVNRGVFNTNEQQIKEYQKAFIDHLNNVKTEQNTNINSMLVQEQYEKMNNDAPMWQQLVDKIKFLSKTLDTYEKNDIVRINVTWNPNSNKGDDTHTMDDIVQKLNVRLNAIRTSNLSNAEKTKLTNDTKTQIDMFVNQQTTKYVAITMLLKNVVPQLLSDLRKLKNINLDENASITGQDYMYHLHSNFGMYNSIASAVLGILNQNVSVDQILHEFNRDIQNEEDKITRDDLESVKNAASTLLALTEEGKNILYILRDRTTKSILINKAQEEDYTEDLQEYLDNMTENPHDIDSINWFEQYLGSMDSASSEALRLLSSIVNKSLKKADRIVLAKGVRLLELEAALKHGESGLDLYELDENGRTTGYLTRRLNFGRFYKNYDNFLVELNNTISKYTDGIIEDTARTAPNDDSLLNPSQIHELDLEIPKDGKMTIRQAWNKLKNKWLDEHCLRKYNSKYYDAWSNVPQVAKDALDSINSQIASLLQKPGVLGSDGYNHYELLTDEEWETLQRLWIDKKLLRSDYDMFGNLKEEGSTAYIIAKALQQLQEDLNMGSESNIKKDVDAWTKAMNRKIEECGGFDAYEKWKRKEKGHGFKAKEFKKWHQRNSRLVFKKDENGDEIIFKDIEDAMQGVVIDYGPEYDQLKEQEKKLLKPYYSQSGEVNAQEIPTSVANKLKDIYRRQFEIKQEVANSDPTIKAMKAKYGEIFSQFIELKDTSYFKQIKKQIKERSTDENGQVDLTIYDALLEQYGRFKYDSVSGFITGFKPHKWLQYMQAIDVEKYMEYQPGDAWTEKVDNQELLNSEYAEALEELNNDSEVECNDPSFIPKKSLYDNSKAFNKIKNSPTLWAFYNGILETMHESNELQTNRLYADDFLLPQITGTLYKRMKRHPLFAKFKIIWKYLIEKIGIGFNPDDYSQIGSNQALDTTTNEGQIIVNNIPIKGRYPDGRTFHIMPQYYTRKLEDPSQISSSLVEIVMSYYKMSNYYSHKIEIKDDCETIVDFLKSRSKRGSVVQFSKNGVRKSEQELSSTGEAAEKFLEMNLYDIRRSNHIYNIGNIQWQWSKTVSLWKEWTTKQNLGCNPKVAITGFLTTMGAHIVNMITGQNYGKEGISAFFDVLNRIVVMNLMGTRYIGNRLTKDVMMLCAEEFDISDQAQRKWEASNRNRLLQSVNKNSIFGFLSTTDFISKSIIMKSILKSHHLYNGEFISKADLQDMRYTFSSDKEFKKALKEWKKAPSLDKLLKEKNHELFIDDRYKDAYEKSYYVVKNRIQKTAEYADGMATPLQKAAISQGILGALVLIHKQYFPLILQHFYGKRVYDYDTHQYKNAVIRILFDYIAQLMQNNLILGIGAGIFTGQAFGGFIGAGIGAGIGVGTWLHSRSNRKKTGERKKSLSQLNKDYFSDFKDRKSTKISYSNRRSIKEAASIMILYRMMVQPLVACVCSIADDDDDERWWLQLLAFSLRGFEWEFYTAFRSDDMLNTFKSPTAATGVLDKLEGAARGITNTIAPQGNMLFNPSETWDDFLNIFSDDPKLVTKGAYKGMTPLEKSLIKLTPQHNLWEQYKDSKGKRTYLENQVMYIQKPEE